MESFSGQMYRKWSFTCMKRWCFRVVLLLNPCKYVSMYSRISLKAWIVPCRSSYRSGVSSQGEFSCAFEVNIPVGNLCHKGHTWIYQHISAWLSGRNWDLKNLLCSHQLRLQLPSEDLQISYVRLVCVVVAEVLKRPALEAHECLREL